MLTETQEATIVLHGGGLCSFIYVGLFLLSERATRAADKDEDALAVRALS